MTYRELLYKATRLIDNNKITIGEYEEMTKPLDREIEQEPALDKIRAEINKLTVYYTTKDKGINLISQKAVNRIFDKYKSESEVSE